MWCKMVATFTAPPVPPRPGSARMLYEVYKNGLTDAVERANDAMSDVELMDALRSIDYYLDNFHASLKKEKP